MSKQKKDLKQLEPEEQLKYEIAEELGLLNQVLNKGWKSSPPRRPDASAA